MADLVIGATGTVGWTTVDYVQRDGVTPIATVKIELSRDNGATWATLAAGAPNTGTYSWTVTAPAAAQCIIKISDPADPTVYGVDTAFAITSSTVVSSVTRMLGTAIAIAISM